MKNKNKKQERENKNENSQQTMKNKLRTIKNGIRKENIEAAKLQKGKKGNSNKETKSENNVKNE